jgi:hypothetical protein
MALTHMDPLKAGPHLATIALESSLKPREDVATSHGTLEAHAVVRPKSDEAHMLIHEKREK